MRLLRYMTPNGPNFGVVIDDEVVVAMGSLRLGFSPGPKVGRVSEVQLLSPVQPSKIVAVGLNYASHAQEMGVAAPAEPLLFLKPPSAVIGAGEGIRLPPQSERVDYEAELAVVIGRQAREVSEEDAPQFILGYTCANDVTARDLQEKDHQWTRAKGFDTFAPLGPWIETEIDVRAKEITCRVNGSLRQKGNTGDLIFNAERLVAYISSIMTLEPGDVILTGTPSGVGPLQKGDQVEVEVEGLGVLRNKVI